MKKERFEKKVRPYSYNPKRSKAKTVSTKVGYRGRTSFIKSPERINVAFRTESTNCSGNRFALGKNDVEIIRDNGSRVKKPMYKQIRELLDKEG